MGDRSKAGVRAREEFLCHLWERMDTLGCRSTGHPPLDDEVYLELGAWRGCECATAPPTEGPPNR